MTKDEVRSAFDSLSNEDKKHFFRGESNRRLSQMERNIQSIQDNIVVLLDRTDPRNGKAISCLPQSVLQGEELSNAALQIADVVVKAMNEAVNRFIEEVKKFD